MSATLRSAAVPGRSKPACTTGPFDLPPVAAPEDGRTPPEGLERSEAQAIALYKFDAVVELFERVRFHIRAGRLDLAEKEMRTWRHPVMDAGAYLGLAIGARPLNQPELRLFTGA